MHRRQVLVGTGALLVAGRARADPPPIHTLDRLHLNVVIQGGVQNVEVTGWKVKVNEDISMDILAWNPGPAGAAICFAHPEFTNFRGDNWKRLYEWYIGPGESSKLVFRDKPDNEDMFFYAEIQDASNSHIFRSISGDQPNSNAGILDHNTKCEMSWNLPQNLHVHVQPTPGNGRRRSRAHHRQ